MGNRYPKRSDLIDQQGGIEEDLRQQEIKDVPSGSGGPVYCYASYNDGGSVFSPYITSTSQIVYPLDTIVSQSGGFSLSSASGRFGAPGGFKYAITVPDAGLYSVQFNVLIDSATYTAGISYALIDTIFNGTFDTSATLGRKDTYVLTTDDTVKVSGATDEGDIYIEAGGQFLTSSGPFDIWVEGQMRGKDETGNPVGDPVDIGIFGLGSTTEYSLLIQRVS
jgi:hypothetical protein